MNKYNTRLPIQTIPGYDIPCIYNFSIFLSENWHLETLFRDTTIK